MMPRWVGVGAIILGGRAAPQTPLLQSQPKAEIAGPPPQEGRGPPPREGRGPPPGEGPACTASARACRPCPSPIDALFGSACQHKANYSKVRPQRGSNQPCATQTPLEIKIPLPCPSSTSLGLLTMLMAPSARHSVAVLKWLPSSPGNRAQPVAFPLRSLAVPCSKARPRLAFVCVGQCESSWPCDVANREAVAQGSDPAHIFAH